MNGVGHRFLAGARPPLNQYRLIGLRRPVNRRLELKRYRAGTTQARLAMGHSLNHGRRSSHVGRLRLVEAEQHPASIGRHHVIVVETSGQPLEQLA
jgi:hypothetical protein